MLASERIFAVNFGFIADLLVIYVDIEEWKGVVLLLQSNRERGMKIVKSVVKNSFDSFPFPYRHSEFVGLANVVLIEFALSNFTMSAPSYFVWRSHDYTLWEHENLDMDHCGRRPNCQPELVWARFQFSSTS